VPCCRKLPEWAATWALAEATTPRNEWEASFRMGTMSGGRCSLTDLSKCFLSNCEVVCSFFLATEKMAQHISRNERGQRAAKVVRRAIAIGSPFVHHSRRRFYTLLQGSHLEQIRDRLGPAHISSSTRLFHNPTSTFEPLLLSASTSSIATSDSSVSRLRLKSLFDRYKMPTIVPMRCR
jgi:hypothetical protein